MNQILFSTVKKKDGISTDEIIKVFENSDDISEIKQAVENASERLYVTWASVETKDKAGELIPIEDMIKQLDTLLKRNGPISDEHTNKMVGETLSYKVMIHPKTQTKGILLLNKIFGDNQLDDLVWEEIQTNQRKGSSVGGYNTDISMGKDKATGERVKVLEGFKWIENASVYNPCNPLALNEAFSVVAKSSRSDYIDIEKLYEEEEKGGEGSGRKKERSGDEVIPTKYPSGNPIPSEVRQELISRYNALREQKKSETDIKKGKERGVPDGTGPYGRGLGPGQGRADGSGMDLENDVKKPFAGFDSFDSCLIKMKEEGYGEESAKRICGKLQAEYEKTKSAEDNNCKKQEDEETMSDEIKETLKSIVQGMESLKSEITSIKKQMEAKPEEDKKPEDEKKTEEEEKKKPEEELKPKDAKKENAASDIEGEANAKAPESPDPESSNDKDVYKKSEVDAIVNKKFNELKNLTVAKSTTPSPAGNPAKKEDGFQNMALDIAMGKKRVSMMDVHKAHNEYYGID